MMRSEDYIKHNIPEQCVGCTSIDFCFDHCCLKEKPCTERTVLDTYDEYIREIRY